MRSFKDKEGREWTVAIDGPLIEDVEAQFGIVLDSWDAPPFERLANEPRTLQKLLAFICKAQLDAKQVDERDFRRAISETFLDAAAIALLESVTDFFPERKRSLRRSLFEKAAAMSLLEDTIRLEKLADPEFNRKILDETKKAIDQQSEAALKMIADTASVPSSATS